MMKFNDQDAVKLAGGNSVAFTTGFGPCCEGKFNLVVIQDDNALSALEVKMAEATLTTDDLEKVYAIIGRLLGKG